MLIFRQVIPCLFVKARIELVSVLFWERCNRVLSRYFALAMFYSQLPVFICVGHPVTFYPRQNKQKIERLP